MAIRPVTLKRKDGSIYHPKTSLSQVEGLGEALQSKQALLTTEQVNAIDSVGGIRAVIPAQASDANQLADKAFVNSSIQTVSADPLAFNAEGDPFPTRADLDGATVFYNGGAEKVPDENDYCTVLSDETHAGAQTRYTFSGGAWVFQYLVNDTPFTAAQNAALNSGITAEKVAQYDGLPAQLEGLGTVHFVSVGADLSAFGDNDLIIELDE